MLASNIPAKIVLAFGANAGGSYIRTVPVASQIGIQDGAASYNDGFPPVCFLPVAGGGTPPFGQDFNGLLNVLSAWCRWYAAFGGPVYYDGTFQSTIGGYPAGAMVLSNTIGGAGRLWRSTVDNNTSNPDTGGANWVSASYGRLINMRIWNSAGTATYTPATALGSVMFEVQGGGGGGGGAPGVAAGQVSAGAPGNAGAFGRGWYPASSIGAGITITVGAAGSGGAGTGGTSGGTSSAGALLSAPGGPGGSVSGAASSNISGGNGSTSGLPTGANLQGEVGGIGTISFGITPGQCAAGGNGGASHFGGGAQGATANFNGVAASSFGAGGGGTACVASGTPLTGGSGAVGLVIAWEFSA
jgi:hypothetical protein